MQANRRSYSDTKPKRDPLLWLKEHTIHIVVLVNGLILSLAIFSTMQLFIGQMLKDDYMRNGGEAKKIVTERFADTENQVRDLLLYLSDSYLDEAGNYIQQDRSFNMSSKAFDALWLIPADGVTPALNLKVKKGSGTSSRLTATYEDIDQKVAGEIRKLGKDKSGAFLFTLRDAKKLDQIEDASVHSRSFAIVRPVRNTQGLTLAYFAAFSSIEKILTYEQILSSQYVEKTTLWTEPQRVVLYAQEAKQQEEYTFGKSFQYDFASKIGENKVNVQIIFRKSSKNYLLELLPYLLASFGIIVTIFAWLIVSNNYAKAKSLSRMNSVLADKNDELNDQIREREKLFQTLRKSERENHAIINAISDVIFEVSPHGEILFLNEAWTRITGFDLETSMGKNLFEMMYPSDQEEQKRNVTLLARGQKKAYRSLTKLRTIEGTFRSVEIVVSMLRQDESKNLRVVGSFTDIEERQRAEHALNEAEKKYKTIWENAAGGIYQLTPDGQILSANPALARIFGYDSPENMMRSIKNAHAELFVDAIERIRHLEAASVQSGLSGTLEAQAVRKNGDKIWVHENFHAVLNNMDQLVYYEGSIEDITQRRESETQLREAKITSDVASRAKSEFLANISHELRTPLNSIIGFSEIIKNEVFGPIEPKSYTEYAGNIYDSGKHLLGIINQILDISRIDAGERELNESLVDIKKISGICLSLSQSKFTQSSLTVIDNIPDNLPKLIAEELAIKQMLLNLLSNAAKFTPHGGRVTLSAEVEATGRFRISVTDTGVGLSPDQIDKASMPFGLVDGRLDKGTGGAGLGLSLVHSLLRLHGGGLEILSQKGIGTTVSMIFPAERIQA